MADGADSSEVRTYHANIVTSNLNVDEMVMEFRRYTPSHKDWIGKSGGQLTQIPAPTAEEIVAVAPIARVVITFSAARALKQYLDHAFPEIDKARKAQ